MVDQAVSIETLPQLLQRMDSVSRKLEETVLCEQEAVNRFDAEALVRFAELRSACHQELAELELQCRDLMRQAGMPDELSLEAFIDMQLADSAPLQALRRKLYLRLAKLTEANEEQRIRLRAAYEVTSSVLRDIGVLESRTTYGPGGAL